MKRLLRIKLIAIFLLCGTLHVWGQNNEPALVILHTNDTHSQIEPFVNKAGKEVGGVLRRKTVIDLYRQQYPATLLLDAGDFSQGTPYFNYFKGLAEIKFMNMMGYDVVGLGNHEFDKGSKSLAKRLKKANFEVVCANYEFHHKPLKKLVKPYTILYRNNLKIGIFGLTVKLSKLVPPYVAKEAIYKDPVETAQTITDILRNQEKCDIVICLSHLGYNDDKGKATIYDSLLVQFVNGIDVLVGGHTHKHLNESDVQNGVRILQLINKGEFIGKLLIYKNEEDE